MKARLGNDGVNTRRDDTKSKVEYCSTCGYHCFVSKEGRNLQKLENVFAIVCNMRKEKSK